MEDRFARLQADDAAKVTAERHELEFRLLNVLDLAPPMFDAVAEDLVAVGIESAEVLASLRRDALRRLDRSIDRGVRAAGRTAKETLGTSARVEAPWPPSATQTI